MATDLKELKRLAEAATPGPWSRQNNYPVFVNSEAVRWPVVDDGIETGETYPSFIANTGDSTLNADFIAAANPAVILDLIAQLEQAQASTSREEREAIQRQRMKERFANRPKTPATADFDLPAPNDTIETSEFSGNSGELNLIPSAQAGVTDEQIDKYLDSVLRASGPALKHYIMQKSKDDMRAEMRLILSAQPAWTAEVDDAIEASAQARLADAQEKFNYEQCRQAWNDMFHKCRPLVEYRHFESIWRMCLERTSSAQPLNANPAALGGLNATKQPTEATCAAGTECDRLNAMCDLHYKNGFNAGRLANEMGDEAACAAVERRGLEALRMLKELRVAQPAGTAVAPADESVAYRTDVDNEMVNAHIGVSTGNARKDLDAIIAWHVDVALDPKVSVRAEELAGSAVEAAVARLLRWAGPKHTPIPHGGIAARTYAEFSEEEANKPDSYWKNDAPLYTASLPKREAISKLTADQIEDCFPDNGSGTCKFPCGKITVTAQFLHDFAHNISKRCTYLADARVTYCSTKYLSEVQMDADRLEWLMRSISGRALRSIGVTTSGNCDRAAIDAAIAAQSKEQP